MNDVWNDIAKHVFDTFWKDVGDTLRERFNDGFRKANAMIVITFSNPKGGTGKTTASLILAEQIAHRGGRVTILDCDPNKNILGWADERREKGRGLPFRVIARVEDPEEFFDQVEDEQQHSDYLLIDLEGTADQLTTFATQAADLVLVPMTLTYMEAKQAHRAVRLVHKMAKVARRKIQTRLLLNRTSSAVQSGDERDMKRMLLDGGADILPVELMDRGSFNSVFKRAVTLAELQAAAEEEGRDLTPSAKERKMRPILGAVQNARAYGDAVLAEIEGMIDVAA